MENYYFYDHNVLKLIHKYNKFSDEQTGFLLGCRHGHYDMVKFFIKNKTPGTQFDFFQGLEFLEESNSMDSKLRAKLLCYDKHCKRVISTYEDKYNNTKNILKYYVFNTIN